MPGFAIKTGDLTTVIPSGAVAAAQDTKSQDIWHPDGSRAAEIIINVTAVGGSPGTITNVKIAQKIASDSGVYDPAVTGGPQYKVIGNISGLTINATGQSVFSVAPGTTQGGYDGYLDMAMPSAYQVWVTTKDSNSITFSARVGVTGR